MYIKFLEMKLVIQRAYVFVILIDIVKLIYIEIVPFYMPSSNARECCFLTALPTQKYSLWIFGILIAKTRYMSIILIRIFFLFPSYLLHSLLIS